MSNMWIAFRFRRCVQNTSWLAFWFGFRTGWLSLDHQSACKFNDKQRIDDGKWNIICGALNTRDPAEFLAPLAALAGSVRCLAIPDQPASLSAAEMTAAALAQGLDAEATTSIKTAFDQLDPACPVIICGSLYLAGHVLVQNKTLPD